MASKIILTDEEIITCPQCSNKFSLHQGITRQTLDKYEEEFNNEIKEQSKRSEERIRAELEKQLKSVYSVEVQELKDKLSDKEAILNRARIKFKNLQAEERKKLEEEFELEKKSYFEEISRKDSELKKFRQQEIELRNEKRKLEDDKKNMELEVQRKIDTEKDKMYEQISKNISDKFRLKESEYQKKLSDAQRANEELERKLKQGSQQLQGEVLELEIEKLLNTEFPLDNINPVKKGERGADILQEVCTPTGQICGTIIWEAKNQKNWSDKWIQKLKDDQIEANAEIAVIVSSALPKDMQELFERRDDIWISSDKVIKPVAHSLRLMLLEMNKMKMVNAGKSEKMELLYDYLCSHQFTQKVKGVLETFVNMKTELDQEKNAFQRIWKKRESQIDRVVNNMSSMIGELQGISQHSIPQLDDIQPLLLPVADDDL